jgi:hypothetical protein
MKKTRQEEEDSPSKKQIDVESSEEHGRLDRALDAIQKSKGKNRADDTEDGANDLEHDDDSPCMHVRQGAPRPPAGGYWPVYSDRRLRERSVERGRRDRYDRKGDYKSSKGRYRYSESPEQYRRSRDHRDYDSDLEERRYRSRRRLEEERRRCSSDFEDLRYDKFDIQRHSQGKQFCELDRKGEPCGKMADPFRKDLCTFARSMDPSKGWEKQTKEDRLKMEDGVYDEWEFYGDSSKVSLKFLKMEIGKALINIHHAYMKVVDANGLKPPELTDQHWEALKMKRSKKEFQL